MTPNRSQKNNKVQKGGSDKKKSLHGLGFEDFVLQIWECLGHPYIYIIESTNIKIKSMHACTVMLRVILYILLLYTGVPGGYNANVSSLVPVISDYIWITGDRRWHVKKFCSGEVVVHKICIITSADLSRVQYKVDVSNISGPMFHNKYFMERDHTVMDCLEKQLVIRNRQEYLKDCMV